MNISNIYSLFLNYPKITTDTRKIIKDSIFFALKGENFNGNEYVAQALENGCKYAVIDEKKYKLDERCILVDNSLATLQELSKFHRQKNINIKVIGITGTNGKTTTKELLRAVLSTKFNVVSTEGNQNNHIGVPLTLLSMKNDTDFGIVEMGANHIGEIELLCNIACPDFGLITNVGKAHLEGFGSFEGVIIAKGELYRSLEKNDKIAFVNSTNPILTGISVNLKKVTYGNSNESDYYGRIEESEPFLKLKIFNKENRSLSKEEIFYSIETQLFGAYNFENIMASVCIGMFFGVEDKKIQEAISNYKPVNNRSQMINSKNNNLYLDLYNANPSSMDQAIRNFASLKLQNKCVILGDMFELGSSSEEEHSKIISLLIENDLNSSILVGKYFYFLGRKTNFKCFGTTDDLIQWLKSNPLTGHQILIKGSRGMMLEKTLEFL